MTQSGRRGVITAGGVTAFVGTILIGVGPTAVDSNHNGVNESSLNDDYSTPLLGTALLLAGLTMAVGGLASPTVPDAHEPPPLATTRTAMAVSAALPELPVDGETLRLAQQARVSIAAGQCESAQPLLAMIFMRAPAYHQALIAGPVLDGCPGLRYVELSR